MTHCSPLRHRRVPTIRLLDVREPKAGGDRGGPDAAGSVGIDCRQIARIKAVASSASRLADKDKCNW